MVRGVPARRIGGVGHHRLRPDPRPVRVAREGLPGTGQGDYSDPAEPYTLHGRRNTPAFRPRSANRSPASSPKTRSGPGAGR